MTGPDDRDESQHFDDGRDEPRDWDEASAEDDDGRLDLAEEDASLPWLESGDEDDSAYEGSDTGRILGFVIAGLIALAVIVGGIWWATHRTTDPELVAEGGTIPAPDQPYKQAPQDPGGKTFDGTGDTSFAVSEGQTRPARLGEQPAASPSVDLAPQPAPAQAGSSPAAAPARAAQAPAGGVGVQVGAYKSRDAAEAGWARLAGNPALAGVGHRIVEGQADIGTVFRLQAVAPDAGAAQALCSRLKASSIPCQVKN